MFYIFLIVHISFTFLKKSIIFYISCLDFDSTKNYYLSSLGHIYSKGNDPSEVTWLI
jgi:hypothetical protein